MKAIAKIGAVAVLLAVAVGCVLVHPIDTAAYAIIRPWKRPMTAAMPPRARDVAAPIESGSIRGWLLEPETRRRPLVVYLHGIADNRASGLWLADRLLALGHPVLLFDSRAHGASDGAFCTFGAREAGDLRGLLDVVGSPRVVLVGVSLGGAVALQAAAQDERVAGVVAISTFSDLRSIVQERAPWPLRGRLADRALQRAGEIGGFDPQRASPLEAAPRIRSPVLLVHGADDRATSLAHSQRLDAALRAPHRLLTVPGAGHDGVLAAPGTWETIAAWLARIE
jgi:pimeloyl-ACP methyl ester carboxylesterase